LTVASGFDLGYHNYVVTDATATHTQRLQDHAEELMGGYLAFNVTTDDCLSRFEIASQVRATP
jgi:nicotinamidase-related amidase